MSVAVAYSDSAEGLVALRRGVAEAVLRQEKLLVFSVAEGLVSEPDEVVLASLRGRLSQHIGAITTRPPEWEIFHAPDTGDTAQSLLELVEDTGARLLVLGARHRSAVGKFLLGNTVQRVVLAIGIPVLIVKV